MSRFGGPPPPPQATITNYNQMPPLRWPTPEEAQWMRNLIAFETRPGGLLGTRDDIAEWLSELCEVRGIWWPSRCTDDRRPPGENPTNTPTCKTSESDDYQDWIQKTANLEKNKFAALADEMAKTSMKDIDTDTDTPATAAPNLPAPTAANTAAAAPHPPAPVVTTPQPASVPRPTVDGDEEYDACFLNV
ncbi:hypothetical protein AC578_6331 [Pseudocercospora eumusae]|uniref:Uncharacterized protein n=1 Tax=Pseudocercospora eumusae TaxID=321146 RepID=A0A139HGP0_9PEZI|nr:hypothetical protein AC578_6331 [Pseudocercospora eumusae]